MKKWYENIEGGFDLPIRKAKDNDYFPSLESELSRYIIFLKATVGAPKVVVEDISDICDNILRAINLYYKTDVIEAQKIVREILLKYTDHKFVFSDLKNSYAFRGITPFLNDQFEENKEQIQSAFARELSFFKARIANDPTIKFTLEQMLHIPFSNRGKVKTQRFSIAGIPCMYFGTSSYVCWTELGKPQNELFNVSSYKIDDDLRVLNLVCAWNLICGLTSGVPDVNIFNTDLDELVIDLLKLWPLVCATSYNIEESNRFFKSEYIISQLIMLCLNDLKIDGVAYVSKQCSNDTIAFPNCINLAIPAKHDNKQISEICKKISVTNATNFGEYMKLNATDRHPLKRSYINGSGFYNNHIELASRRVRFDTSIFGTFDDFLVSFPFQKVNIDNLNI